MKEAPTRPVTRDRRPIGIAIVTLLAFFALVGYGAAGLRGSDQYWYAGDLRMLGTTGHPITNAIYPVAMLGKGATTPASPPPFVHNQPVTYLAALLARMANPYAAWVGVNVLFALGTAALVVLLARRVMPPTLAALSGALFLVFPFTTWLTVNALSDMSLAFGAIALALGASWEMEGRRGGILVVGLSVAFLYWSRESFILLVPAFGVWAYMLARRGKGSVPLAVSRTLSLAVVCLARSAMLPGYPHAGISTSLMALTPGSVKGNMHSYFSYGPQAIEPGPLLRRIAEQLLVAFVPNGANELVTETLVLVILGLTLWTLRRDRESLALRLTALALLAIYILTAIAFQSHNRYLYVLVPLTAVLAGRAVSNAGIGRRALAPGLGILAAFAGLSFVTARTYRAQALQEIPLTAKLADDLRRDAPEGGIALIGTFSQQITYVAVPRNVIALDAAYVPVDPGAALLRKWGVRLLLLRTRPEDLAYAQSLATRLKARLIRPSVPILTTQREPLDAWLLEPAP